MSYILLCNTGSDSLSRINVDDLSVENLYLSNGDSPFGPHGLSKYKENALITNNYNNSISIINISKFKEEKNLYIGAHPNDVTVISDVAYVTCGESNSLIIYDLTDERIIFEVPTGRFPHDISAYNDKELVFISNMGDNTISVIDTKNNEEIQRIVVENTPLKIIISNDKKYIYVCMSYLGYDHDGYIGIISLNDLKLIEKIKVGFSPVDLVQEGDHIYVSNLCDGCVSDVNINTLKQERKIRVGGMPRGIIKSENKIFVGDYLNGIVNVVNLEENNIKAITVGREPNAMTFIK